LCIEDQAVWALMPFSADAWTIHPATGATWCGMPIGGHAHRSIGEFDMGVDRLSRGATSGKGEATRVV